MLDQLNPSVQALLRAGQCIFEIIDTEPEVADAAAPIALPLILGTEAMRNVVFAYEPSRPVLHDISMGIGAGEMIRLVGHAGADESTLINIITRLYDVDEGSVAIDGVDVKQIALADLRVQVAIILQAPFLLHGTVIDNVGFARAGAIESNIVSAPKTAYAHDFIVLLPAGYDMVIGPKRHKLSSGERQRVAIARAILHDPRTLVLDEAISAVDTETKQQIQEALFGLTRGRRSSPWPTLYRLCATPIVSWWIRAASPRWAATVS